MAADRAVSPPPGLGESKAKKLYKRWTRIRGLGSAINVGLCLSPFPKNSGIR